MKASWFGAAACAAAILIQPVAAAPLTQKDALELSWKTKPLFMSQNLTPSWIGKTHRFLFSRIKDGKGTIVEYDADTGRETVRGEGQGATVSPDGSRVLFLAPDVAGKSTVLWMMGIDGNDRHMVDAKAEIGATGAAYAAWAIYRWAPDGKRFAMTEMTLNQYANVKPSGEVSTAHAYPNDTLEDSRVVTKITIYAADGTKLHQWGINQGVSDANWLGNDALIYSHTDGRSVFTAHAGVYMFDLKAGTESKLFDGYGRQQTYHPLASPDGKTIAFVADPGEPVFTPSRRELALFDTTTHAIKVLTENAAVHLMRWSDDSRTLYFTDGFSTQRRLKALQPDGRIVTLNAETGQTEGTAESGDGKLLAWMVEKPFEAYVIHVAHLPGPLHAVRNIAMQPPAFGAEHGTTTAITWKSPDGTAIDGLLTVPPGFRRGGKYPLVVQIHGGPMGGVEMTDYGWPGDGFFDALLASNGYVVLRPDYRSSGQLGWDAYLRAKQSEQILAANQADIESGVQSLIDAGTVDPHRMVVIGLSYGGVMTNFIATHSKMFAAGIGYEGFDYLIDWAGRPEWPDHNVSMEWEMGGTPFDHMANFMANSIVPMLQTATTPMMLINGEHGINTASSPLLYNALRMRGIEARFVYYDGEGHGIQQHANQVDLLARIMDWIGKYAPVKH
jgi:dipeptidyl aminopeptidase/acylaminoacyl peptidase